MSFFEYLDNNKDWLFSGGGVVLIGYLTSRLLPQLFRQTDPPKGAVVVVQVSNQQRPQATASDGVQAHITKITSITLAEISAALENSPPLQKDDVAKHYEGITIQWETKLFGAEKDGKENVRLTLDFGPGDTHLVYCNVRLSDYRELGVLPKGAPITVMGRIRKVERKSATLEDVQLFFHGAENA